MVRPPMHRLRKRCDVRERPFVINVLEGTRPLTFEDTWPERASTGVRSTLASYSPVSRFVDPGPAIPKHAATSWVSLP